MTIESLRWKKYPVLNDGFVCLVDVMGDDASITQAARVSYGNDIRHEDTGQCAVLPKPSLPAKDRALVRYLLNHGHTSPFEMVEFKFLVRVPMDCWRQWIRHRTANVNEYSTRYTEAIDSQQITGVDEWRLQATDNKQGSSGFLTDWPEGSTFGTTYVADDQGLPTQVNVIKLPDGRTIVTDCYPDATPGRYLSAREREHHLAGQELYQERLSLGIAKEQARKDLPLSNYTEAYWKIDLHNLFNFLRLRMDSHAQQEVRLYANAMYEIVKQVCPVACEAFEDYVLHAKKFSRMEMEQITWLIKNSNFNVNTWSKPDNITDREWKEFLAKIS